MIRLILGVILCMSAADAEAPLWAILALSIIGLVIAASGVRALEKQS
jgi:hypothetical protein